MLVWFDGGLPGGESTLPGSTSQGFPRAVWFGSVEYYFIHHRILQHPSREHKTQKKTAQGFPRAVLVGLVVVDCLAANPPYLARR